MFANECATMRSQGKKHNYMMRVSLGTKLCRRCFKIKGWGQFAALTLVFACVCIRCQCNAAQSKLDFYQS